MVSLVHNGNHNDIIGNLKVSYGKHSVLKCNITYMQNAFFRINYEYMKI